MGNLLIGKGSISPSELKIRADEGTIKASKDTIRANQGFKCHLIP